MIEIVRSKNLNILKNKNNFIADNKTNFFGRRESDFNVARSVYCHIYIFFNKNPLFTNVNLACPLTVSNVMKSATTTHHYVKCFHPCIIL